MHWVLRFFQILFFCFAAVGFGQVKVKRPPVKAKPKTTANASRQFNRYDRLRGELTPARNCYDVYFYGLNLKINPADSSINGYNIIAYRAETDFQRIQIDLFNNLKISRITHRGKPMSFTRDSNAVFVNFNSVQAKGTLDSIVVHYGGRPRIARNPPWDGGFVWTKDATRKPWVAVACEGTGASLWWPCKDHLSDEPDSMHISVDVPNDLMCVSNGNLKKTTYLRNGFARYDWRVQYPINNYNVTVNIGKYDQITDTYTSPDGRKLALDYYVMPYNRGKAEKQFRQVKPMLAAYEKYFGPYPFWNDGYALVETPYLGMEHQSAIAYGNGYENGYHGKDLSGVGLPFDYILIHETGHEYWGNNVGMADHGEMWINESFCTYAEALYVEEVFGKEKALQYLQGQSKLIQNTEPVLGPLNVNFTGAATTDMYFKGSNMLHTLRNVIGNDSLWFGILRGLQHDFGLKQVHTQDITDYINAKAGTDFNYFFDQYLKHPAPPTLTCILTQTRRREVELQVRWTADVAGFAMPIKIRSDAEGGYQTIRPTSQWQTIMLEGTVDDFRVATELYYVLTDIRGKSPDTGK